MSKKSSTDVFIAATASRTKTKRNGTKIHYICDTFPGPALDYLVTLPRSIRPQPDQMK
jgi:hypothetical protein